MSELTVYTSTSDGYMSITNEPNYTTAHNAAEGSVSDAVTQFAIMQAKGATNYIIRRAFLFFDTSSLPDAALIIDATLSIYVLIASGNPDLDFDVVIRNGQPTYPHDPLVIGDYYYDNYSGDGGSFNTSEITGTGYQPITLNSTGRGWINKTGATKLALISRRDIDYEVPTFGVSEAIAAQAKEYGDAYRAKLVINYCVVPTGSTPAVTDIGTITATGNGNITNIGGVNCTKRGICWNTTGSPTVADSKAEEEGNFGTGAFTASMTGLIRGEKYYVKAYAYNLAGYGYGSEVNFYTKPSIITYAPTDIIRADPTVVTANGLIDLDVVEDITTRGFEYGLTETNTWSESETGVFTEGTFSLQVTGLDADTTYYIRAYTIGAWGTKYGSYVAFKTAYPYGSFKTEIKTEATASQSDIDDVGGKRTLKIENHLIQTQTIAEIISAAYLADYKDQKTKLIITRPCPAPFEIGDTVTRGARIPYAPAATAVISYAPAATALVAYELAGHDMLIRKLSVSFSAGNYVSILELET